MCKALCQSKNTTLGSYLLATKDKGLIMKPNQEGMECWEDAAHATEWNNKTASNNPSSGPEWDT
jgi:hypothetical protein